MSVLTHGAYVSGNIHLMHRYDSVCTLHANYTGRPPLCVETEHLWYIFSYQWRHKLPHSTALSNQKRCTICLGPPLRPGYARLTCTLSRFFVSFLAYLWMWSFWSIFQKQRTYIISLLIGYLIKVSWIPNMPLIC